VTAPGVEILDIAPTRDRLVLEALLRPVDIDVVRPGLPAPVRLVANRQRTTSMLEGRVTMVSAYALVDDRADEAHVLAFVEVDPEELARAPPSRSPSRDAAVSANGPSGASTFPADRPRRPTAA
jgi:hypothetical protein